MTTSNSRTKNSFNSHSLNKKAQLKKKQVISATFAKREYLLRELKETDAMLHHFMNQINLDEEYKKLNRV